MQTRTLAIVTALAVLGLLATSIGWVTQARQASAEQERADALSVRVTELEDEVAELERAADDASHEGRPDDDGGGPADMLGDLFGDDDGLVDGLLDGLLDGEGGLAALAGGAPGAACLQGDGDLFGGLLDGDELPDEPEELVTTVADQVAEMRELAWDQEVEVDFLDDADLSARLEELIDEDIDPTDLEAQQRLLSSLGALDEDLDLAGVQRDLMDEQVAGYYVPETAELAVRLPDGGQIGTLDQVTLAHELQHALADQSLGLPDLTEEPLASDADAQLGALGLIEGDATLLMQQWMLEHTSMLDQLEGTMSGDLAEAQASLDEVPHYLQRELMAPYADGLDYVCELWLDDGWAAVDDAYAQPPTTSYEVLFPDQRPVEPATPADLHAPADATTLLDTTFGAAPLQWLFEAPGGDPALGLDDPRERVAAWDGGQVTTWDRDGETITGISLRDGQGTLCDSVADWHTATLESAEGTADDEVRTWTTSDQAAALHCDGDEVRTAVAPDAATATGVVE